MLTTCRRQRGNALFLILIAVILFAALSYAITQSNRSSGDASEVAGIGASSILEYSTALSNGLMRMQLRGGDMAAADFTAPSDAGFSAGTPANQVFHPSGAAVTYQLPDPAVMDEAALAQSDVVTAFGADVDKWRFSGVNTAADGQQVIDFAGPDGMIAVAALWGIKKSVCEELNRRSTGSKTIPSFAGTAATAIEFLVVSGLLSASPVRQYYCYENTEFSPPIYGFYAFVLER